MKRRCRRVPGGGDQVDADHRDACACAGQQQIGVAQLGAEVGKRHDRSGDARGQGLGALDAAVDDSDVTHAGPRECCRDALADLACAEHDDSSPGERAEAFGRHFDGGVTDGGRAATDRRLGAGSFTGLDRMTEQQVERGLGCSFGLCQLPRRTYLAEDLALTENS